MVKLLRFEKLVEERLNTIEKDQLWISSPSKFNDLDDCKLRGLYSSVDDANNYQRILKALDSLYNESNRYPLSDRFYQSIKDFIQAAVTDKTNFEIRLKSALRESGSTASIRNLIRKNVLVSCFFEGDTQNSLMWAHYANNHKGFCIEYELEESDPEIFDFNRVNYVSSLPEIYATELLFNPYETVARIIYSKSIEWSYEKEWRYVELYAEHEADFVEGKNIRLPDNLKPTRIITGSRINNNEKNLIEKLRAVAQKLELEVVPYKSLKT